VAVGGRLLPEQAPSLGVGELRRPSLACPQCTDVSASVGVKRLPMQRADRVKTALR
jgi:hypothetical protein